MGPILGIHVPIDLPPPRSCIPPILTLIPLVHPSKWRVISGRASKHHKAQLLLSLELWSNSSWRINTNDMVMERKDLELEIALA